MIFIIQERNDLHIKFCFLTEKFAYPSRKPKNKSLFIKVLSDSNICIHIINKGTFDISSLDHIH